MENSRDKQFISFNLRAILSSVIGISRCPTPTLQDMNYPFVQRILPFSPSVAFSVIKWSVSYLSTFVQVTLILLNNGRKAQEEWCRQFGSAKGKLWSASFKWRVTVLDLMRKEKKLRKLLRSRVRMNLLPVKLWRRKKKFLLVLLLHLKLQKLWLQCMVHT